MGDGKEQVIWVSEDDHRRGPWGCQVGVVMVGVVGMTATQTSTLGTRKKSVTEWEE